MIQLEAILRDKGALADGTRRILLDCQEAVPEQLVEILKFNGKIGWFLFSEAKIDESKIELPKIKTEFEGEKTPSERLRNVMYLAWKQKGELGDFESWRRKQMEYIINQYKDKLD